MSKFLKNYKENYSMNHQSHHCLYIQRKRVSMVKYLQNHDLCVNIHDNQELETT